LSRHWNGGKRFRQLNGQAFCGDILDQDVAGRCIFGNDSDLNIARLDRVE
jgi:hypothetical protein